jgi:acyl dehydratase
MAPFHAGSLAQSSVAFKGSGSLACMEQPTDLTVATLDTLVGREFAPTAWITVDQPRIDQFADCTDDHQFIHVDPERVARETPFPRTLAHGFLLLSLVAGHRQRDFPKVQDIALVLNYGMEKVRFTLPVFSGSRVRYHTRVVAAEPRGAGRVLLRQEARLEVEGQDKPALLAELLSLYIARGAG